MVFAAAGAASRLAFRDVETRWQILAFSLFATALEAGRAFARSRRPLLRRILVDVAAAATAIVAVKSHLEPGTIPAALDRLGR